MDSAPIRFSSPFCLHCPIRCHADVRGVEIPSRWHPGEGSHPGWHGATMRTTGRTEPMTKVQVTVTSLDGTVLDRFVVTDDSRVAEVPLANDVRDYLERRYTLDDD